MLCKNCGNQLREGAAFCPKCGTAVKPNTETAEQEYMPLTPKFDNVDTDKPIQDRIKAIDKPLFEDNTEVSEPAPKKESKKKLIIALCVILAVIIVIGVIALFEINRPPLTLETAYDEYISILEKNEKEINKFSQTNESDNIVLLEDGETEIPCVLYLTYNSENEPVLHSLFAKGKSVEIDSNVLFANYEIVQKEKMTFFKVDSDGHIYFWLGKNLWQSDIIDGDYKYLAQRYSAGDNRIGFEILENGDKKEVTEKEYNNFISKYLDNATSIIISALPDSQTKKVFPNATKNQSMNYDEAIAFLKKKQPLSNQQSESKKTNEKENISIKETKETTLSIATEPPTEQPTEPSTEPQTEARKAEDYIKIYQEDTYYNKIRNNDISYVMPLFSIESTDAEAINGELVSAYEDDLKSINTYINEPFNDGVYAVDYKVWRNDNILSLCIERKLALSERYLVYNIDISTGKRIDNEAIAKHYGTTYNDMFEKVRSAVDTAFTEKFKQYKQASLEKYRSQTTSDDNINQSILFIGDNNQLYVMYEWFLDVQAMHGQDVGKVSI